MSGRSRDLPPSVRLPGRVAPLGYRNYFLYWSGFLLSSTGRWAEVVGALWLVYELTDSPVMVGLLGVMKAVPNLLVGPIGGVLADRIDQRRLLFSTQTTSAVLSLLLGALVVSGTVELWHIYVQVALQAAVTATDQAARQALFPRLIPRRLLPDAVTLGAMAGRSSSLAGPAVGGILIATSGVAAPFFANAILDIGLILALRLMRGVVPRARAEDSSLRAELVAGFEHVLQVPILRALLTLEVVYHLFHMSSAMIAIIGRERLGVGPEGLGGLLAASALGSMTGVVVLLAVGLAKRQGRFNLACTFVYAAGLVAFALAPTYQLAALALVGIGFVDALVGVGRNSIIQLVTPGRMRGRTMANTRMVTSTSNELAQTQGGLLSEAFGGPTALMIAAGTLTIGAVIVGKLSPELWNYRRDEPPPVAGDVTIPDEPESRPGV